MHMRPFILLMMGFQLLLMADDFKSTAKSEIQGEIAQIEKDMKELEKEIENRATVMVMSGAAAATLAIHSRIDKYRSQYGNEKHRIEMQNSVCNQVMMSIGMEGILVVNGIQIGIDEYKLSVLDAKLSELKQLLDELEEQP